MRNGEDYAVAVRRSDGSITVKKEKYKGFFADSPLKKIPFIRGVFVFIDSMILGLRCTDYSASIYAEDDPEEAEKASSAKKSTAQAEETGSAVGEIVKAVEETGSAEGETRAAAKGAGGSAGETGKAAEEAGSAVEETGSAEGEIGKAAEESGSAVEETGAAAKESGGTEDSGKKAGGSAADEESPLEKILMAGVMVLSFALAIGLFMVLPYFIASRLVNLIGNANLLSLFEGVIRIGIFVGYILLISMMKDIRRLFMYHGAEHKCINCLESGHELTVDNAAKATRLHKRCGSSFILFVMMVSIVLFFFIRVRNPIARVGIRILLLPVISGISYELIRFAGSSDNPLIALLSKPGLWLQGLTTKEPDEEMLAVAIESVNAVFDWRAYLEKEFGTGQTESLDTKGSCSAAASADCK